MKTLTYERVVGRLSHVNIVFLWVVFVYLICNKAYASPDDCLC